MLARPIFAALVFLAAPIAQAHSADCSAIQDARARLACYDAASKSRAAKKPAPDEFAPAKQAMLRKLSDPDSARWADLFHVDGGAADGAIICGKVNSKNQMGGYAGMTGFVYLPQFDQSILMFNGVADPEWASLGLTAYCKYCAADPRGYDKIRPHCH
jgi:hypothetical protein